MAKQDTAATTSTEPALTEDEIKDFEGGWEGGVEVPDKGSEAVAEEDNGADSAATEEETTDDSDSEDETGSEDDSTEEDKPSEDAETTTEEETTDEDSTDEEAGDKGSLSPEEQKRHNDEMAKARIAERQARDRAAKAEAQAQEATIERYLREAGDDETELERRKLNVEAWRVQQEKITVNRDRLTAGIEKAVANIPLFRTGSPAIQEELAASLDDFEKMYVVKDDQGRPTQVLGDVFTFLQNRATSIQKIQASGATQQERDKSKQKSKTTTPPRRAPKKAKVDEGLEAFAAEAARN